MKMKKYICLIAAVCLLGTAAFCGYHIYDHYANEAEQTEAFENIAEIVEQAQAEDGNAPEVPLTEEENILTEYGELYLKNTDMVGWLSIAGTTLNYPVMQTPNEPNYYLKRNFEKEYSDLGTPYIQENCDLTNSDNLVIYGHHIKGGKMFGALEDYKSQSFYEEHKTIQFDTLTQRGVKPRPGSGRGSWRPARRRFCVRCGICGTYCPAVCGPAGAGSIITRQDT